MTDTDGSTPGAARGEEEVHSSLFGTAIAEIFALLERRMDEAAVYRGDQIPPGYKAHVLGPASTEIIAMAMLCDWLAKENTKLVRQHNERSIRLREMQLYGGAVGASEEMDSEASELANMRRQASKLKLMYELVRCWIGLEIFAQFPDMGDKTTAIDVDRNVVWLEEPSEHAIQVVVLGGGDISGAHGLPPGLAEVLRHLGGARPGRTVFEDLMSRFFRGGR